MSVSDESVSYCEYCKGILLTENEKEIRAHKSCFESVSQFQNSVESNIEYYRLPQQEYEAILELEKLNSYLSDESIEANVKVITSGIYNNLISTISFDLSHIFNFYDIQFPDFPTIFDNFKNLLSLNVKKANYIFIDNLLQINNRVFFLNLSDNNLEKLPHALFKIRSLRILNLSNNLLTELPLLMTGFRQLTSLHLSNNRFDRLPRFIMNYSSLKTLKINGNQLTLFPSPIMFLKNLIDLDISNNAITSIPLNIKYLKLLTTLTASYNAIKSISDVFQDLTHLRLVDLSHNELQNLPLSLLRGEKIFSLNVSHNKIKTLNALPNTLNTLNLSYNEIEFLPEIFYNMEHLTTVNISHNNLKILPKSLLDLPNLRYLKVTGNPLTESIKTRRNSVIIM